MERHHLWPKDYLKMLGVTDTRDVNQIANFTVIEWDHNPLISNKPPSAYVPVMQAHYSNHELERMYHWHALPDNWQNLPYPIFLRERRELMARVIKEAYLTLMDDPTGLPAKQSTVQIGDLVEQGETPHIEFKSTLRKNLHTGQKDPKVELAVLKTIGGFLNTGGGTLIVGAADDGTPIGIDADEFANEDKMSLHPVNLLKERLGAHTMIYIHPRFEDFDHVRVMAVECMPARSPVFVKNGQTERFYVRSGAATTELSLSEMHRFVRERFDA